MLRMVSVIAQALPSLISSIDTVDAADATLPLPEDNDVPTVDGTCSESEFDRSDAGMEGMWF